MTAFRVVPALLALVALAACDSSESCDTAGISDTCLPPEPSSITIELSDSSVAVGEGVQVEAAAYDASGDEIAGAAILSASDPSILALDQAGEGYALAPGDVYVIARAGELADSVLLHVAPDPATVIVALRIVDDPAPGLNELLLEAPPYPVIGGIGRQLRVESIDANGETAPYTGPATWSSSDSSVATVDATGHVQAVSMGHAVISVEAPGIEGDTSVAVVTVPGYDVQELGFEAVAMNELGHIVGTNSSGAVMLRDGELVALGEWRPTDVNDLGVVVGYDSSAAGRVPVRWRDGELDTLAMGAHTTGRALAINDDGVIVGLLATFAARWVEGTPTTLDAASLARGIDAAGTAVGSIGSSALVWGLDGEVTELAPSALSAAIAEDRNSAGWTVGSFSGSGGHMFPFLDAVVWTPSGAVEVNTAPGNYANTGINDAGVIIGYRMSSNPNQKWPYVQHPGFPLVLLHRFVPDGALGPQMPTDIDEQGRILVRGRLLTPRPF